MASCFAAGLEFHKVEKREHLRRSLTYNNEQQLWTDTQPHAVCLHVLKMEVSMHVQSLCCESCMMCCSPVGANMFSVLSHSFAHLRRVRSSGTST